MVKDACGDKHIKLAGWIAGIVITVVGGICGALYAQCLANENKTNTIERRVDAVEQKEQSTNDKLDLLLNYFGLKKASTAK
jgi:hypothetical protein